MIPNTEITISENKILVTSMIYVSAKDEFDKAKIIIHNHYPNAQKGYEDNYKVFVEV